MNTKFASKIFEPDLKEIKDRLGRIKSQELLITLGIVFTEDAVDQAEKYTVYDFIAKNSSNEIVSFEAECRDKLNISTINASCLSSKGHSFTMHTIHHVFRKRHNHADYFISYIEPCPFNNMQEAMIIFNRYDVMDSPLKISPSTLKQGETNEFKFDVPIGKGMRYIKKNDKWIQLFEKIKPLVFTPLYAQWKIDKENEFIKKCRIAEDYMLQYNEKLENISKEPTENVKQVNSLFD